MDNPTIGASGRLATAPMPVHGLLDAAASQYPDAVAVMDAEGSVTYRRLADGSRRASGWLWRNGVRPRDRVVLHLPGGRDFAMLLYGVLRLGAIAVPVHPRTGLFHLRWMIQDAAPALTVSTPPDVPAVRAAGATSMADTAELRSGLRNSDAEPASAVTSDDIALLMYTSGSTAMPRAVVCPHERVRFAVSAIADSLGYTHQDVVLSRIPVSFDYGLYQLFLCSAAGACLVLRPDLSESAVLREVRAVGATVIPIVPSLADILLRLGDLDPGPTAVRLLTNTGAALTGPCAAGLRRTFPRAAVVPMYGMTECKRVSIASPDEHLDHPGTVGRPLAGTEVLIVDSGGAPARAGGVGEIWVRGPHVMAGYWRDPEATRTRFDRPDASDRLLRTGDFGYVDKGGRLYFVGRRDDIFKHKGVRTSAQEIEAAVLDIPGVSGAAVIPPTSDGVLTVAVAGDLPALDVLKEVARRIEPAKVPDDCVVLPTLPVTNNGKVDRHALRTSLSRADSSREGEQRKL